MDIWPLVGICSRTLLARPAPGFHGFADALPEMFGDQAFNLVRVTDPTLIQTHVPFVRFSAAMNIEHHFNRRVDFILE